ncbi:MAG: CoA transferase [Firmicutes bacterium]|nr:CoA transferase [Bacillota bacterium]
MAAALLHAFGASRAVEVAGKRDRIALRPGRWVSLWLGEKGETDDLALECELQVTVGAAALNGEPDYPARCSGFAPATLASGCYLAAIAVAASMTEAPCHWRLSAFHAARSLMQLPYARLAFEPERVVCTGRLGGQWPPNGVYPTQNGFMAVLCPTDRDWEDLGVLSGDPFLAAWSQEPEFRRNSLAKQAEAHIAAWLAFQQAESLAAEAQAWRLPWAPLRSPGARYQGEPAVRLLAARSTGNGALDRGRACCGSTCLPLAGLRILDLTTMWSGPSVTRWLQALGAEVVKLESRRRPDGLRLAGASKDEALAEGGPAYRALNDGKRHVFAELDTPAGRRFFLEEIAETDLLIENFTPRVMENFGLDEALLWQYNPRLLWLSMPGFGGTSEERNWVGYGATIEAASGAAWLTQDHRGRPMGSGYPVSDGVIGAFGCFVALALLRWAEIEGMAAHAELSQVRFLAEWAWRAQESGLAAALAGQRLEGVPTPQVLVDEWRAEGFFESTKSYRMRPPWQCMPF